MTSARKGLYATLLLCVAGACQGAEAGRCTRFEIAGEVRGDQQFHAVLGMGLSFRMEPTDGGWQFEIGPTGAKENEWDQYVYPLNPPYRNRRPNMLDTSYGVLAQDIKDYDHSFWFMTDRAEASAGSDAVGKLLRPRNGEDIDSGLAQLRKLSMGRGEFFILDADVDPGTADPDKPAPGAYFGAVRKIGFRVEFTVPASFSVNPKAKQKQIPCPDLRWGL